jgi:hypothetical protein
MDGKMQSEPLMILALVTHGKIIGITIRIKRGHPHAPLLVAPIQRMLEPMLIMLMLKGLG